MASCKVDDNCYGQGTCGNTGSCICKPGWSRENMFFLGTHCTNPGSATLISNIVTLLMAILIAFIGWRRYNAMPKAHKLPCEIVLHSTLFSFFFAISKIAEIIEGYHGFISSIFYCIAISFGFSFVTKVVFSMLIPIAKQVNVKTVEVKRIVNWLLIGASASFIVCSMVGNSLLIIHESIYMYNIANLAFFTCMGVLIGILNVGLIISCYILIRTVKRTQKEVRNLRSSKDLSKQDSKKIPDSLQSQSKLNEPLEQEQQKVVNKILRISVPLCIIFVIVNVVLGIIVLEHIYRGTLPFAWCMTLVIDLLIPVSTIIGLIYGEKTKNQNYSTGKSKSASREQNKVVAVSEMQPKENNISSLVFISN